MGGITVLFSGDFRQILPVIAKGTRADEVNACLKKSYLWPAISSLHLTKNMRISSNGNPNAAIFADLLLKIGSGKIIPNVTGEIEIPANLGKIVSSINDLMSEVYPNVNQLQEKTSNWLCERAILCPKNDTVYAINNHLLENCNGEMVTYTFVDTTCEIDDAVNFPTEFLNSLELTSLPPHKLHLKINAPVMLLRNLDAPRLCNGTRLKITKLRPNIIEGEILTGCARGEIVLIP